MNKSLRKLFKERLKEIEMEMNEEARKPKKKRKKEKKLKSKAIYEITLGTFQFHCYEAICDMNDIPFSYYFYPDGSNFMAIRTLKINSEFRDQSCLCWDESKEVSNKLFYIRFTTLLLYFIICNTHGIIETLYYRMKLDKICDRWEVYTRILREWSTRIDKLILSLNKSAFEYYAELNAIYEYLIIGGKYEDESAYIHLEAIANIYGEIELDADDNAQSIIFNNLVKASYCAVTNSLKVENTPYYNPFFKVADEEERIALIGGLGTAIIKHHVKKKHRIPSIYQMFLKANPMVACEDMSPEYIVGAQALSFLKFIIHDKMSNHYINRLLNLEEEQME